MGGSRETGIGRRMVRLLESLGDHFRKRAAGVEGFSDGGARAFAEAAEHVDHVLRSYLSEYLTIKEASVEFGWDYEALRQRLKRSPDLRSEKNGRPAVARAVMLEQVGRGRGPRSKVQKSDKPRLDSDLRSVLAGVARRSNRGES